MSLVDEIMERSRKARACKCPHCGRAEDDTCEMGDLNLVTYWGSDDGPIEVECPGCSKTFYVREWVERTYSVGKTSDEADELDMQRYK